MFPTPWLLAIGNSTDIRKDRNIYIRVVKVLKSKIPPLKKRLHLYPLLHCSVSWEAYMVGRFSMGFLFVICILVSPNYRHVNGPPLGPSLTMFGLAFGANSKNLFSNL